MKSVNNNHYYYYNSLINPLGQWSFLWRIAHERYHFWGRYTGFVLIVACLHLLMSSVNFLRCIASVFTTALLLPVLTLNVFFESFPFLAVLVQKFPVCFFLFFIHLVAVLSRILYLFRGCFIVYVYTPRLCPALSIFLYTTLGLSIILLAVCTCVLLQYFLFYFRLRFGMQKIIPW